MAVLHPATIVPGKLELLQAWVPRQPWISGADASSLTRLGSYRFDDSGGKVGMETFLLGTADGKVLQVPLTYRGAPREGADDAFITTMSHTALGERWIYDGCYDPVFVEALATTILDGGREADLFAATDAGLVLQPATTHVRGSGSPRPRAPFPTTVPAVSHTGGFTRIDAGLRLVLARVLPTALAGDETLTGTWPGQATPAVLAALHRAA